MFYFLTILGIWLIVLGISNEKDDLKSLFKQSNENMDLNRFNQLDKRIEEIEKIIFFSNDFEVYLKEQENIEDYNTPASSVYNNSSDKYALIEKYEEEGHSLDEICSLLDMKKGEVILLKNLHKNYK